jgi:RNA polymerase sigma factor (sigma-70 family)
MTQPEHLPELGRAESVPGPPEVEALVEGLAARYRDRLRFFAARRLGSVDAADDVAQETLRRVTDALRAGRVRQAEALPGFVFQTAQHVCQQHHRSEERETRSLLRLAGDSAGDELPDQLSGLIADERRRLVHRALARLRTDDRELLRQIYFSELEPEVVAARLALTAGALRVRKHRALQRLAELIKELDP